MNHRKIVALMELLATRLSEQTALAKSLVTFFNLILALALAIATLPAQAAVPQTLNYQGQLTNAAGVPVNGTVNINFKLYGDVTGGSALWSETQNVAVSNGLYSVTLGQPANLLTPSLFGMPLYLGISVNTDAEMTPRIALSSSATALRASLAETANTLQGFGTNTGNAGSIGGTVGCVIGEVRLFSSVITAEFLPTNGQLLPIATYPALFSLIGTNFGGDGATNFQLPDLRAITPNNMTYAICQAGTFP